MLENLRIKNIAVIDSSEISFKKGLNILSGETGAGKSIVIEAISLLLGSRASAELIRSGCNEGVVEGLFDISDIPWIRPRLEGLGFSTESSELLIKRTVHRAGKHRIYVNGELATLSALQNLCEGLVDLCGQHEHQTLVKPATQLELLDRYGGLGAQAKAVAAIFALVRALKQERNTIERSQVEQSKRLDFLSFQLQELRDAGLKSGEDARLQAEKQLLQSAETRVLWAEGARGILEADEGGALNALKSALQKLRSLAQLDANAEGLCQSLERALAEAEDVDLALGRYLDRVDLNPERLEKIQDRLSLIANLRRKYGSTVEEMLVTFSQLEDELKAISSVDERLQAVVAEFMEAQSEFLKLGRKLSHSRKKISEVLSASVTQELKDLKMEEARFTIDLSAKENIDDWSAAGADAIQFLVQTNRGDAAKPLSKIASGGELSRLMLSIRRVIADRGGIGVYLFDEIDAGIGGQTAFQVGKKLKSVAAYNQVICITHLPQVASFANHHLVVRKGASGKRTFTEVIELSSRERREELARMLGGPELTKKSLENAAELLELARV